MILPHGDKPIYDGTKKWNSKVCQFCGVKFRDGQDVVVMPMELKGAHRAYELVFCVSKWTMNCMNSWRMRHDVFIGNNFDGKVYCNKQCDSGDSSHEHAEI